MGYSITPSDEGVAVAVVISVFLCLAGVEYGVARAKRRSVHRFSDSMANLACGAAHQVANLYYTIFVSYGYEFLRHHFAIASIDRFSIRNGVALFLLLDLIYYWEHRLLHARREFWASHVVHHQSGEFNLTVALRVSILQVWMTIMSAVPFAIVGFPCSMTLTVALVSKLYQFGLHTRLIGSLGAIEWVFVTPSHHRVHHASNASYLDKNFGGMLIIWDRIFGTFEPEREAPVYGVAEPVPPSFNPVLANLRPWLALRRAGATARSGSTPQLEVAGMAVKLSAVLRLVAVVGLMMALLLDESAGVLPWLVVMPVSFVWLWQQGRILDGQRPKRAADAASVVLALGAGCFLAVVGGGAGLVTGALLGGSLLVVLAWSPWPRCAR